MQRDEFLPLRVIRQELATGTFDAERRPAADVGQKRRALTVDSQVQTMSPEELAEQAGVSDRVPARARRVRRRPARPHRRPRRASTRPTSRSSAPPPSWRSTASPAGTFASFAPPPTARRRCSSSSSARRFARAAPPAGARRSRTSRTSPPSAATSSSSSWSATFAASRATRADPLRAGASQPDEGHPHAHGRGARPTPSGSLVSDPHSLPRWWPKVMRVEDVTGRGNRSRWTAVLETDTRKRRARRLSLHRFHRGGALRVVAGPGRHGVRAHPDPGGARDQARARRARGRPACA